MESLHLHFIEHEFSAHDRCLFAFQREHAFDGRRSLAGDSLSKGSIVGETAGARDFLGRGRGPGGRHGA